MGNGVSNCDVFKAEDTTSTIAEISYTSSKSGISVECPASVVYVDIVSLGLRSYTSDSVHQHDLVCANMAWQSLSCIQRQQREFNGLFYGFVESCNPQLAFLSQSVDFQKRFVSELVRIMMLQLEHRSGSYKNRVADFVNNNANFGITLVDCKSGCNARKYI